MKYTSYNILLIKLSYTILKFKFNKSFNLNKMSYFIWMQPEEEGDSYNGEEETVQYTVHFAKLKETICEWFNKLFALKEDHEKYIKDSLSTPDCPPPMYNLFEEVEEMSICLDDDEEDEDKIKKKKPKKTKKGKKSSKSDDDDENEESVKNPTNLELMAKGFQSNDLLFKFLKKQLGWERYLYNNKHSVVVGTTMEFDHEWAFFEKEAVESGELTEHLKKLIKLNDKGEVERINEKIIAKAYL